MAIKFRNPCAYCNGLGHGDRTGSICRMCSGSGQRFSGDPMDFTDADHREAHARQLTLLLAECLEALRHAHHRNHDFAAGCSGCERLLRCIDDIGALS